MWCHVTGTDLVRDRDGQCYVLEDNLRVPSGVSYVLENRKVLKRIFPQVFEGLSVRPVNDYPSRLLEMLESLAPQRSGRPTVVLLTPGIYNSAYFEHSFLAQQMGVQLVESRDLEAGPGGVFMRTTRGLEKVDVIYRRIDDDFLDPQAFRPDSLLGYLALWLHTSKARWRWPMRPETASRIRGAGCEGRKRIGRLRNAGRAAFAAQREEFAANIQQASRNYVAQPTLALSRVPTIVDDHFEGRHVDLRPYVLCGKQIYVLPGGLTRVAMR